MKRAISVILIICLIFTFVISGTLSHVNAVNVREAVRIGLYYKSTAQMQFNISAEKGLEFGTCTYSNNDNSISFSSIASFNNSAETYIIRKDSYFVNDGGNLKEYSPTAASIPTGTKSGPYHVKIGGNLPDMSAAVKKASELKQKGVDAYPVFADVWQVWGGFFSDGGSAQSVMNNMKSKTGAEELTVINPPTIANERLTCERVIILNSSGSVSFLFSSEKGLALAIRAVSINNTNILKLNSKKYRGEIIVRRLNGSDMTIINSLAMNQYLYSVVPAEIGGKSPAEALKAQAVAARTYAMKNIKKHNTYHFDLCATTDCQAYYGFDYETSESLNAVEGTSGKVITYKGQLIDAVYFASDGGRTEDSENVWLSKVDYLRSVEDPYESPQAPSMNWQVVFTADQLKNAFGGSLGNILSVDVTKRSASGRAIEVVVTGTSASKTLKNENCRTAFGASVTSQFYTITTDAGVSVKTKDSQTKGVQVSGKKVITAEGIKILDSVKGNTAVLGADGAIKKLSSSAPAKYTFTGKGGGHAVGMSQEGAIGMAKAGKNYIEILKHFYTGVEVE